MRDGPPAIPTGRRFKHCLGERSGQARRQTARGYVERAGAAVRAEVTPLVLLGQVATVRGSDGQLQGCETRRAGVANGPTARRDQRGWIAAKLSSRASQHWRASRAAIAGITHQLVIAAPFDLTGRYGSVSRQNWRLPVAASWRESQFIRRSTLAASRPDSCPPAPYCRLDPPLRV